MKAELAAPAQRTLLLRERSIVMLRLPLASCVAAVAADTTVYLVMHAADGAVCHRLLLRYYGDVEPLLQAVRPLMATPAERARLQRKQQRQQKKQQQQQQRQQRLVEKEEQPQSPTSAPTGSPNSASRRTSWASKLRWRSPSAPTIKLSTTTTPPPTSPTPETESEAADSEIESSSSNARRHRPGGLRLRRKDKDVSNMLSEEAPIRVADDEPLYDVRTMAGLSTASTLSLDSGYALDAPHSSVGINNGDLTRTRRAVSLTLSRNLKALTLADDALELAESRDDDRSADGVVDGDDLELTLGVWDPWATTNGSRRASPSAVQQLQHVPACGAQEETETMQRLRRLLADEGVDLDDNAVRQAELNVVQELRAQPYYHGHLDWEQATKLLDGAEPGAFLVRAADDSEQDFIISAVNSKNRVQHLTILQLSGRFRVTGHSNVASYSVTRLLDHHVQNATNLSGCVLSAAVANKAETSE